MSLASKICLMRIEDRIAELTPESRAKARMLSIVIEKFAKEHGALGHCALNLATARMADEVLPE